MALCEQCGNLFKRNSELNRHLKEKHSEQRRTFTCSFCQRPFARILNLKRHLCKVHKVNAADAQRELKNCKDNKMPKRKLEAMKLVYVSQGYEDISSDEDVEPKFVKVKMDEPMDTFSINSDLLDEMVQNSGKEVEDYLDDLLNMGETGRSNESETAGELNVGNEQQQEENTSRCENTSASAGPSREPTEDAGVDTADIPRTEVTTVCLTLVRTTTQYRDGTSAVNRRTHISHSNNVDPHTTDFSALAMDILTEVPEHLGTGTLSCR